MNYRLLVITLVLICPTVAHAQAARYARVISQTANLRETPAVTSTSIIEITEDTLVKVLDEKLPWYVVRIGNRVGWMHGDTLEFINTSSPVTSVPIEQTVAPVYSPRSTRRSSSSESPSGSSASDSSSLGNSSPRSSSSGSSSSEDSSSSGGYIRGPRGGCYYISASGRKIYVDRSMCN